MSKKLLAGLAAAAVLAACGPQAATAPAASETAAQPAAPIQITVPAGVYKLDPTHGSVTFRIKHFGLSNYTARFANWDSEITFDPANPSASTVKASIDPASVRTDYPGDFKASHPNSKFSSWDEELGKGETFLGGAPITFQSTTLEVTGPDTGKLTGDLTLKGVTKPVTLDVKFNGEIPSHPFTQKPVIGFSGMGLVKRTDFGVATTEPLTNFLGEDVEVMIEGEFHRQDDPAAAPAAPASP